MSELVSVNNCSGDGLTFLQFNVLRIIRGTGKSAIALCGIRERLVTPTGEVSLVLARLESAQLFRRKPVATDGRVLNVYLTQAAETLLVEMDSRFK